MWFLIKKIGHQCRSMRRRIIMQQTRASTFTFPTRGRRYFAQLPETEMRRRSESRRRSYRFLNRLTDYQLQCGGYVLICRRGTHTQVISVFCHSSCPMTLLWTATFFSNSHHANHASLIHFFHKWVKSSFRHDPVID